jgi:hypothetical protein
LSVVTLNRDTTGKTPSIYDSLLDKKCVLLQYLPGFQSAIFSIINTTNLNRWL